MHALTATVTATRADECGRACIDVESTRQFSIVCGRAWMLADGTMRPSKPLRGGLRCPGRVRLPRTPANEFDSKSRHSYSAEHASITPDLCAKQQPRQQPRRTRPDVRGFTGGG